ESYTITFDDKARAEVAGRTFTVAKDANIQIDGNAGKLADLPAGAYVGAVLRVDQKTIGMINAQGPRLSGVVKAVDADKSTITVGERTFPVAPDAWVVIAGQRSRLAALATGASVNLNLRVDQKTVRGIQTITP